MYLVSILIPNYNKANFLRETLDSVLAQTYSHWECIIVDDQSTDDSWEILEDYAQMDSRFKIYKRPENRKAGGNAARNYAFEMSKGEFINWLDSDDLMHQNSILKKVTALESNLDLDFVIGNILEFNFGSNEAIAIKGLNLHLTNINYALESIIGSFWIQTSLPLFQRRFLNEFDVKFHEDLKRGQEAEFFVRILLLSNNFLFIPDSILYWRRSLNSKTSDYKIKSLGDQYKSSFPSYKLIYESFENAKEIDNDVRLYFSKIFQSFLSYTPIYSRQFFDLLLFVLKKNVFINDVIIIKIVLVRIFPFLLKFK